MTVLPTTRPLVPASVVGVHRRGIGAALSWCGVLAVAALTIALGALGLRNLLGGGDLSHVLSSSWTTTVGPWVLGGLAVLFVMERRWPATPRRMLTRSHLTDAGYLVLFAAATVPGLTVVRVGLGVATDRWADFLVLSRYALLPQVLVVIATVVAMDAANWACHVANHRSESLWRLHAVHHSQEEMSVFTTFRTHPLVHATYLPVVLPFLVLGANGTVPTAVVVGYGLAVAFVHSNLRFTLGPVGRVVVSPAYHRLHHARDAEYGRTVNYGFVLVCWDRLAGRAAWPVPGQPRPTGLEGRPVPVEQSPGSGSVPAIIGAQLVQPFRLHWRGGNT